MVSVELGNIGSEEQAHRIKAALQNQTFYDFQVTWSPAAGNYPVSIVTWYKHSDDFGNLEEWEEYQQEVKDMVLFVLATEV